LIIFRSKLREHAGQDLQSKVLFIAQSVGTTLQYADFVVQSLDKAEGDFVLWLAVGSDAIPVSFNHVSEVLVGLQALSFELRAPVAIRKALGIERIVGQKRQSLALHRATLTALNPTNFDVEYDAKGATRQISHLPPHTIVEAAMHRPASPTVRFFARRAKVTTRVCGSPKRPRKIAPPRKPGNEYASAKWRRLGVLGIGKSRQIYPHLKRALNPKNIGLAA
jgi:hypothetical protein